MLCDNGIHVCSTKGVVLFEPLEVTPDTNERLMYGFGSVGFFLNACDGHEIEEPLPAPTKPLRKPASWPRSQQLRDLQLDILPLRPNGSAIDWAQGIIYTLYMYICIYIYSCLQCLRDLHLKKFLHPPHISSIDWAQGVWV